MEFKTYLTEGKRDTVVFSHGRMNPVTVGHQKMVDVGQKVAKRLNADYELSITHSHDPKKNPLSVDQKLKHVKRAFPKVRVHATSKEAPSFLHVAKRLHAAGYKHLVMVAGSDRQQEYHDTLHKYNGHPDFYNFKSIRVPNKKDMEDLAGESLERDPDSEGAEGMSASKMRHHASHNDYTEFRKGVPAHFSDAQSRELYNDVRQGQVRKESLSDRQRYINGEIYNLGDRVITEQGLGEIVHRGETYVTLELGKQNKEKYWIADLEETDGYHTRSGKLKQNPRNPSGLSKKYSGDLSHSTQLARRQHFKKSASLPSTDPKAYKPAPGDAESETRMSKYTKRYHERFKLRESKVPFILLNSEQRLLIKEETQQLSFQGYTTSNLDLCPGAVQTFQSIIPDTGLNPTFVLKALQATDAMLGVERMARAKGFADELMTHDFVNYLSIAYDTLHMLGVQSSDLVWLKNHMEIMSQYGMRPEANLAKIFGTMAPVTDKPQEVEESMNTKTHTVQPILVHQANGKSKKTYNLVKTLEIDKEITEAADSALSKKAQASGISIGTLRQVYKRGVAAWRTGHRPGTTPQQWGMARVNSYITKGKTYHTADKDLREQEETSMEIDVTKMGNFKHMDSPAENPERDLNFNGAKDTFHGLDQTIPDQHVDGKPVGLVSFKTFMHEPEFVRTAAEHDAARSSIHAAQVKDFAQHGVAYKSMAKRSQLEP